MSTNNETVVRAALVLAEGIFETGETMACHPASSKLSSYLLMRLTPPRDVPVDIHIKVGRIMQKECYKKVEGVC